MNSTTTVGTYADPDGTEPKVVHLQVEPESAGLASRRVPVRGSTHNGAREKLARGRPRLRAIMAKLLRTRESSASAAEACSHQIWVAASRPSSAFVATRQRVAFGHCACSARFAPLPEYAKFNLRPFAEQSPGARGLRTRSDVDVLTSEGPPLHTYAGAVKMAMGASERPQRAKISRRYFHLREH